MVCRRGIPQRTANAPAALALPPVFSTSRRAKLFAEVAIAQSLPHTTLMYFHFSKFNNFSDSLLGSPIVLAGTKLALNCRRANSAMPCPPTTCVIPSPSHAPAFRSIFKKTRGAGTKLTRRLCLTPSPSERGPWRVHRSLPVCQFAIRTLHFSICILHFAIRR